MTPHMRRNYRTVGSCARMCSHPFRDHIGFHRRLVWLLPDTHKPDRPLNSLKTLKPSDAYTSNWIRPSSVQTMACPAISLTNVDLLFTGAKEIFFYEIIFEIQRRNLFAKVICKMSVILSRLQWFRVSPLNYMWTGANFFAESLWVSRWLSCAYILVPGHLIPGASFTDTD